MISGTRHIALLALALGLGGAAVASADEVDPGSCVRCHAQESEALSRSVGEWQESVHARVYVSCDSCHGGDPREEDSDDAKAEETGFEYGIAWTQEAEVCGMCHEEEAAHFEAGAFGRRMREGVRVPTCRVCHMPDGHRIETARPEDLDIRQRCPQCEGLEDPELAVADLGRVRERVLEVRQAIRSAEAKGIDLSDLEAELLAIRTRHAQAVHAFGDRALDLATALCEDGMADVEVRAREFDRLGSRRRLYGVWVLCALASLTVALIGYRRRVMD